MRRSLVWRSEWVDWEQVVDNQFGWLCSWYSCIVHKSGLPCTRTFRCMIYLHDRQPASLEICQREIISVLDPNTHFRPTQIALLAVSAMSRRRKVSHYNLRRFVESLWVSHRRYYSRVNIGTEVNGRPELEPETDSSRSIEDVYLFSDLCLILRPILPL